MSVISFPYSAGTRSRSRQPVVAPTRSRSTTTRRRADVTKRDSIWKRQPARIRATLVASAALLILVLVKIDVTTHQMNVSNVQSELVTAQSNYAMMVAKFSGASSPARVSAAAGSLHLAAPSSVLQVTTVSLNVPLALPHFNKYVVPSVRSLR